MSQKMILLILGITILVILTVGLAVVSLLWVSSVREQAYLPPTLDPAVISTQAAQILIAQGEIILLLKNK